MRHIRCARCGETYRSWLLWRGFALGADLVCCLAGLESEDQ